MGSEIPYPVIWEVFWSKNFQYALHQQMVVLGIVFPQFSSFHPSSSLGSTTVYEVHFECGCVGGNDHTVNFVLTGRLLMCVLLSTKYMVTMAMAVPKVNTEKIHLYVLPINAPGRNK